MTAHPRFDNETLHSVFAAGGNVVMYMLRKLNFREAKINHTILDYINLTKCFLCNGKFLVQAMTKCYGP